MLKQNYNHNLNAKTSTVFQRAAVFILSIAAALAINAQTPKPATSVSTMSFSHYSFFSSINLTSNNVYCMIQDSWGFVWVGTTNGLNRYDGYNFVGYRHNSADPSSLRNNYINTLHIDKDGDMWVGTGNGLSLYNRRTNSFEHFMLTPDTLHQPSVTCITEDASGTLYAGTGGYGLYRMANGGFERVEDYDSKGANGFYDNVLIDSDENLWKSDQGDGLFCFNMQSKEVCLDYHSSMGGVKMMLETPNGGVVVVYKHGVQLYNRKTQELLMSRRYDEELRCAMLVGKQSLLLGTVGSGVQVCQLEDGDELEVNTTGLDIDLTKLDVSALLADHHGNLWVGCMDRGLAFLYAASKGFQDWSFRKAGIKSGGVISSVCTDNGGTLWMAVQNSGLYYSKSPYELGNLSEPRNANLVFTDSQGNMWVGADRSLYSFDPVSHHAVRRKQFDCSMIRCLADDGKGTFYVSTFSRGLTLYNVETGETTAYSMYQTDREGGFLCNDWILAMLVDKQGLLWMATASGVSCYSPADASFKPFGWHNLLNSTLCLSLAETADGNIIVGSFNGLYLYDRRSNSLSLFPHSEELQDLAIEGIQIADGGDLWCSTSYGIWHYSAEQQRFRSYINGNGLTNREYLGGVSLMDSNGNIIFGTSDGLVAFQPSVVAGGTYVMGKLMLTGIRRPASSTDGVGTRVYGSGLREDGHNEPLIFDYEDNTFVLEFSTFDFGDTENMVLEYRLDNGEWMANAPGQNSISFIGLHEGDYKLDVRMSLHSQLSESTTYLITVHAPWYRTWWAYSIYSLAVLLLIGYLVWIVRRRRQLIADEDKMRFLINATHDIRTPLTLIINPLHQLMKSDTMAEHKDKLAVIDHNTKRVLNLVNQILDIRKMDKQQMKLQCRLTDLSSMAKNACKTFEYNAKQRNIVLNCTAEGDCRVWVDRMQFDKVFANLLSNAFKYTPDGGVVQVILKEEESDVRISVQDNGKGLKPGDEKRIFRRFYRSGGQATTDAEGTGIGLNLCQMIVDVHHGTIEAHNLADGVQGCVFTVTLPKGSQHLKPEEMEMEEDVPQAKAEKKYAASGVTVLLVDDDPEIAEYVESELSPYYRFTICQNGKQAIAELLAKEYDLVVSDIMMPEMDGFTLLRLIKTNANIAHIPVVLLTSEAVVANRLEGLKNGADAFLAKPFLLDELHALMDSLIANNQRRKGRYSGAQQQKGAVENVEVEDFDKKLMDKIIKSVNKNISNPEFTVELLSEEVGVSRTQLHRKMKALTGISASEFIRNIRLEQAARLLKERHVSVSDVAYSLGFNNLAHFSSLFKSHFGVPPSRYGE